MKNMEGIKARPYFSYSCHILLMNSHICHLQITFANRFGSKLVDTQMVFLKDFFLKKVDLNYQQTTK